MNKALILFLMDIAKYKRIFTCHFYLSTLERYLLQTICTIHLVIFSFLNFHLGIRFIVH